MGTGGSAVRLLTSGEQPAQAGRAVALARLRSALARTTTTGRPAAVFLVGPAGAGKTRLVREFAGHARRDAAQVWIGSLAAGPGRPSWPGWYGRLTGLGGQPTVLVVEDLHLADAVTCGLLGVIGHVVRRGRLLIVATYRDGEVDSDHPLHTMLADLPPTMADTLHLAAPAVAEPDPRPGLTVRERQVLVEIAAGRTNRQIARKLFISENTVSIHVSRILAKLEVDNRTAAAATVHRLGLR